VKNIKLYEFISCYDSSRYVACAPVKSAKVTFYFKKILGIIQLTILRGKIVIILKVNWRAWTILTP